MWILLNPEWIVSTSQLHQHSPCFTKFQHNATGYTGNCHSLIHVLPGDAFAGVSGMASSVKRQASHCIATAIVVY